MDPFLFGVALFLIVFLSCILLAIRKRKAFATSPPPRSDAEVEVSGDPISDAEFLVRCSPGVDPRVALKVREIVAEHFGVEYERVHPSTRFIEDLGAD